MSMAGRSLAVLCLLIGTHGPTTAAPPATPKAPPAGAGPTQPRTISADASRAGNLARDAIRLLDGGQLADAETRAGQALAADRNNAYANYAIGRVRFQKGQVGAAVQAANQALSQDADHVGALYLLARIHILQKTPLSSLARVNALAKNAPDNLGVQLVLAELQLAANQLTAATRTITRVLKKAETSVAALKLLARVYIAKQRPVTAESILRRAIDIQRDPEALVLLAGLRAEAGDVIDARVKLEEAVNAEPGYVEALNSLGSVYVTVRNYAHAVAVLQRAIGAAPAFAPAYLNLGSAQRGNAQFAAAEASWKKVLTIDQRNADAHFNLGVLYLENDIPGRDKVRRLTDAINAFRSYKRMLPTGAKADASTDKYVKEAELLRKQEQDLRKEQLKQPNGGTGDAT